MTKLVTILTVLLTVNTFAATTKKAAKKAPVAKPATTETAPVAQPAAPAQTAPETVTAPQVNPQPAPVAAATTASAVAAPAADVITGTVDLRPSFTNVSGEVHTENWVDVGYKTGDWHFQYEQDFATNLHNPSEASERGLNLEIQHGMFRIKRANLWQSEDKTYSLSYELRPFVPTWADRRDRGMITSIRNYAKFDMKASDSLTLSIYEIPIAHIFNRAGYENVNGKTGANPGFENRVYLLADWSISDKWSLFFPLNLNSVRTREFNGVAAGWTHLVWTQPEFMYAITKNYSVGLSWYNDTSFMAPDLSGFQISDAFKSGVSQIVLHATL